MSTVILAQCPSNIEWEDGTDYTIPTDGSCPTPVICTPGTSVDNLTGNYTISSCATVNFTDTGRIELSGTMTIEDGATVTSTGHFRVAGGTLTVDGNLDVGNQLQFGAGSVINVSSSGTITAAEVDCGNPGGSSSGTLNLNGNMVVSGAFNNYALGTLSGSGYLQYNSFNDAGGAIGGSLADCIADAGAGSCGDITLPVVLLNFEGSLVNNEVELSWSTASEINNEGFFIERSYDANSFSSIGFVDGHGSSSEVQNYIYVDPFVHSGSYYRLKQVDFDGAFKHLPPVYISGISDMDTPVTIYPNPSQGAINFTMNSDRYYDVSVTDLTGKSILKTANSTLSDAQKFFSLFLPSFERGIYLVLLESKEHSSVIRLVLN